MLEHIRAVHGDNDEEKQKELLKSSCGLLPGGTQITIVSIFLDTLLYVQTAMLANIHIDTGPYAGKSNIYADAQDLGYIQ